MVLYTVYVYPFEIAAVILLVAIVAAIRLTLRRRPDSKYVDPSRQVFVRKGPDRVRVLQVASEPRRVAPPPKAAAAQGEVEAE
jgi:NADH-quinone oxidoreductase subunit J